MNYIKLVLIRLCKVVIIIIASIYIISFLWVLEYLFTGKHPFIGPLEKGGFSDNILGFFMNWIDSKEKSIKSKLKK